MTRHELRSAKNRLEDLEGGGDYPMLTISQLLSADEIEEVEGGGTRDLCRIDGQIYDGGQLKQATRVNL